MTRKEAIEAVAKANNVSPESSHAAALVDGLVALGQLTLDEEPEAAPCERCDGKGWVLDTDSAGEDSQRTCSCKEPEQPPVKPSDLLKVEEAVSDKHRLVGLLLRTGHMSCRVYSDGSVSDWRYNSDPAFGERGGEHITYTPVPLGEGPHKPKPVPMCRFRTRVGSEARCSSGDRASSIRDGADAAKCVFRNPANCSFREDMPEPKPEPKPEREPCKACSQSRFPPVSMGSYWSCGNVKCGVNGPNDDESGAKWDAMMRRDVWEGDLYRLTTAADLLRANGYNDTADFVLSVRRHLTQQRGES